MNLHTRLQELLQETNQKPAHLAKAVGAQRATVSDWVNGKTKSISGDYHFKVAKYFGVSAIWLATGKGDKYAKNIRQIEYADDILFSEMDTVEDSTTPPYFSDGLFNLQAIANTLSLKDYDIDSVCQIQVPDNAQGPRLQKGDTCVLVPLVADKPRNNRFYAIRVNTEIVIRFTSYLLNGDLKLLCKNPEYSGSEEVISKDHIHQLDIAGELVYVGFTP